MHSQSDVTVSGGGTIYLSPLKPRQRSPGSMTTSSPQVGSGSGEVSPRRRTLCRTSTDKLP
jgi:hypothetical protein